MFLSPLGNLLNIFKIIAFTLSANFKLKPNISKYHNLGLYAFPKKSSFKSNHKKKIAKYSIAGKFSSQTNITRLAKINDQFREEGLLKQVDMMKGRISKL